MIVSVRLSWTTQEHQIRSIQFSTPDITCINLVFQKCQNFFFFKFFIEIFKLFDFVKFHFKILLNLSNVKILLLKLLNKNSFIKNIMYFILSTDKNC